MHENFDKSTFTEKHISIVLYISGHVFGSTDDCVLPNHGTTIVPSQNPIPAVIINSNAAERPYSGLFWSVFSRIRTEHGPEKLRKRTLFTQCAYHI